MGRDNRQMQSKEHCNLNNTLLFKRIMDKGFSWISLVFGLVYMLLIFPRAINATFGVFPAILVAFFLFYSPYKVLLKKKELTMSDWIGIFLFIGLIALIFY